MSEMDCLEYIGIITDRFKNEFEEIYKSLKIKNKSKILNFVPEIFNKWCASAMFEETVLTPYSMVENLNNKYSDKNSLIFPIMSSSNKRRYTGMHTEIMEYSVSDHPIIYDIKKIIEILNQSIECDENGFIKDEYADEVLESLTIKSYGYFEYLFFLACNMGIYKKMPSLYTDVYVIDENKATEFVSLEKRKALDWATDSAIDIFLASLNEFMPDEEVFIDKEFIMKYIKSSNTIDDLMCDIYSLLDIDIDEIFSKDTSELEEYDNMLLSTVLALGSIIDKAFLTPFSMYFHYIQPMFLMPLDIRREIDIILSSEYKYEAIDMLLMPAHQYSLTKIASEKFGLEYSNEYGEMFEKMPVEYILDNLEEGIESFRQVKAVTKPKIYSFKVDDGVNNSFIIEMEENRNLADFHRVLCQIYAFSYFDEYSFYLSEEVNPFNEYTPSTYTKLKHNKTELTLINTINFEDTPKFLYCNFEEVRLKKVKKSDCLTIEFLDIHENNTSFVYPRAIKFYK